MAPLWAAMITFFSRYAKAWGLSPIIACFSWHNPDSVWCLDVTDFSSGNPKTCPEGKPQDRVFSSQWWLPKLPSTVGLEGVGALWHPSLWPHTFCHKRTFLLTYWRICTHTTAGGILLSWQIFIQVYLKLVALLFLNPAGLLLPSGTLFGPSNSGQRVWRVFCF